MERSKSPYVLLLGSVRQYPNACKLDHSWVSTAWLDSVGLSQYSASFDSQLVDARLLNVLSRKDLDKHLNVHNKFHQSSILHGVHLLRMMRFDVQVCHSATLSLLPMTPAPETGARKLASVSGAGFSRQLQNFWRQKPTRTNKK